MDFRSVSSFFFLSTFLALFFTESITSSTPTIPTKDHITLICNDGIPQIHDCFTALQSIRGALEASDLKALGHLIIDDVLKRGTYNKRYVRNLSLKATDKKQKDIYSSCSKAYGEIVASYQDAKRLLQEGDYQGVNLRASAALDHVTECENVLKESQDNVSDLNLTNSVVNVLSRFMLRLSNKLPKV